MDLDSKCSTHIAVTWTLSPVVFQQHQISLTSRVSLQYTKPIGGHSTPALLGNSKHSDSFTELHPFKTRLVRFNTKHRKNVTLDNEFCVPELQLA